jgi:hypothetical protein
MTLVLTEVSRIGIAMAADSAITKIQGKKILEVDHQGWKKLLRVPKINAGISYWGMIGAVTNQQFDVWLQDKITNGNYDDLNSFADYLVVELNMACKNVPLKNGYDVGIHVAGYSKWTDNVVRPTFFHIHNGHGRIKMNEKRDASGNLLSINPIWDSDPRKLFEKHFDFPDVNRPIQDSINILNNGGWITRNGDFFLYVVFQKFIDDAVNFIHLSPNIRIPKNPTSIASRKGFLHIILESIIRLYRCSNQSKIVGGTVTSLAIGPKGYIS